MTVTYENFEDVLAKKRAENKQLKSKIRELNGFIINNLTNEQAQNEVALATLNMRSTQDRLILNNKAISKVYQTFKNRIDTSIEIDIRA